MRLTVICKYHSLPHCAVPGRGRRALSFQRRRSRSLSLSRSTSSYSPIGRRRGDIDRFLSLGGYRVCEGGSSSLLRGDRERE